MTQCVGDRHIVCVCVCVSVRQISLLLPHEWNVWLTVQVSSMCVHVCADRGGNSSSICHYSGGLVFLLVIGSESLEQVMTD